MISECSPYWPANFPHLRTVSHFLTKIPLSSTTGNDKICKTDDEFDVPNESEYLESQLSFYSFDPHHFSKWECGSLSPNRVSLGIDINSDREPEGHEQHNVNKDEYRHKHNRTHFIYEFRCVSHYLHTQSDLFENQAH